MPRFDGGGAAAAVDLAGAPIPIAVGGLPSPESIFAVHSVAEIIRRTRGTVRGIALNAGEDAGLLAEATAAAPIVPYFDAPDRDACASLLATGVPIVVVMGDFAQTAQFCMVARELDPLQAARFVSQSFCCLAPLQRHSQVRSVMVEKAQDLGSWFDDVADWLGLDPSMWPDTRAQMFAEYAAWPTVEAAINGLVPDAQAATLGWEHVPAATEALFATFAASYHTGAMDVIFWPGESMLEPGSPAAPVGDRIALTGAARLLTFGPFMHLPPGRWRARYQFEVDAHPAGNAIVFDVVHGTEILVSHRVSLEQAGTFGIDCEFDVHEPRLAVEKRAILAEGSIGGFFSPIGIRLNRVS